MRLTADQCDEPMMIAWERECCMRDRWRMGACNGEK